MPCLAYYDLSKHENMHYWHHHVQYAFVYIFAEEYTPQAVSTSLTGQLSTSIGFSMTLAQLSK